MITIDAQKCTGCGSCVRDCYPGYLTLAEGRAQVASGGRCLLCGHCVAVCPQNAVSMAGFDMTEAVPASLALEPEALQMFMKSRRSVRQFLDKPVPRNLVEEIIEAGRYTPTGSNSQSVGYLVLEEALPEARRLACAVLDRLSRQPDNGYAASLQRIYQDSQSGRDTLFHGAPLVIVVIDYQPTGINGALAASRMELMANALGLGACFVGFFIHALAAEPALGQLIQLPEGARAVTTLAIGYPAVHFERVAPRKAAQVTYL